MNWKPADDASLTKLWNADVPGPDISKQLGRSPKAIRIRAARLGLKRRPRGTARPDPRRAVVEELLAARFTIRQVAVRAGVHKSFVERVIVRNRPMEFGNQQPWQKDADHVALALAGGGFPAYDLPRPTMRLFHDGERLRRAYG